MLPASRKDVLPAIQKSSVIYEYKCHSECRYVGRTAQDGRMVWSVCLWSCRLGFDFESGQTNDFETGIHSFPACRSALKGQCGKLAGKFTCAVGKGT